MLKTSINVRPSGDLHQLQEYPFSIRKTHLVKAFHAAIISLTVILVTIILFTPLGSTWIGSLPTIQTPSTLSPLTGQGAIYPPLSGSIAPPPNLDIVNKRPLAKFVMKHEDYAGPEEDPLDKMPFTAYDLVPPKAPGMVIPNVFHYIWLDHNDELYLTYSQYLAMKSVVDRQKPFKIYIHCNYEPKGVWWHKIRHHFTINHIEIPNTVYGQEMIEFAHRTDILRILILEQMGGVYLDIDVFLVKELDDLMYEPYTMGQGWPGLFMASVMLSKPHAPFLARFKAAYKGFNPGDWLETSSWRPTEIAKAHPEEIQAVDCYGFFWPSPQDTSIFDESRAGEYDFFETGQYTYHGWNHYTGWKDLQAINPMVIVGKETSFNRMLKGLVDDEDLGLWMSVANDPHYQDLTHA